MLCSNMLPQFKCVITKAYITLVINFSLLREIFSERKVHKVTEPQRNKYTLNLNVALWRLWDFALKEGNINLSE